ncbi:MAG: o-succinylbenzoate synthase [Acidobacteria bacterium]|nr:MAG: o-succinylbenzoate synthase [Acidobacteriota bacterium]REK01661.1 MAG: o-succinylbenzoate synthase [Acidobacteriota bacterium]REK14617.1 MAG: o-succinylbenzoate synthase [Acidobacteriota bacterium]REK45332.1 MAG: o-succinylbenzoate synthase [Acidobacteriota bacterium]
MDKLHMKEVRLSEIAMPLKSAFETSFGVTTARRVIVVRLSDGNGSFGYGECTAMDGPFYNHETVDSAWGVISRFIVPILRRSGVKSAGGVEETLGSIQGNRMAIAAIETAAWDLEAVRSERPLWQLLGGKQTEIDCGVSIGIQESPERLVEKVGKEIASGYQRIKIKIKPGADLDLVSAVRREFPDIRLSVDANAAYRLEKDIDLMKELDEYDLLMIEQPLAGGALLDHSKLQAKISTPICLDESITSLADAKQAVDMDACRIINIKLGRVGGHTAARAIQDYAVGKGIPVWCGGMLETGIGRAHNIAMSTLEGFTLPGDVSASARYWDKDITEPVVEVSPAGTICVPNNKGIGYGVNEECVTGLTVRSETFEL